jgi:hypothetical protein
MSFVSHNKFSCCPVHIRSACETTCLLVLLVPWLRRLVACLPSRRPDFAPASVHDGSVVDRVVMGQVCRLVFRGFPVNIIPLWLHTRMSPGGRTTDRWWRQLRDTIGTNTMLILSTSFLLLKSASAYSPKQGGNKDPIGHGFIICLFAVYLPTIFIDSVYIAWDEGYIYIYMMDWKGCGRKRNHEKSQPGSPVACPRFEHRTPPNMKQEC